MMTAALLALCALCVSAASPSVRHVHLSGRASLAALAPAKAGCSAYPRAFAVRAHAELRRLPADATGCWRECCANALCAGYEHRAGCCRLLSSVAQGHRRADESRVTWTVREAIGARVEGVDAGRSWVLLGPNRSAAAAVVEHAEGDAAWSAELDGPGALSYRVERLRRAEFVALRGAAVAALRRRAAALLADPGRGGGEYGSCHFGKPLEVGDNQSSWMARVNPKRATTFSAGFFLRRTPTGDGAQFSELASELAQLLLRSGQSPATALKASTNALYVNVLSLRGHASHPAKRRFAVTPHVDKTMQELYDECAAARQNRSEPDARGRISPSELNIYYVAVPKDLRGGHLVISATTDPTRDVSSRGGFAARAVPVEGTALHVRGAANSHFITASTSTARGTGGEDGGDELIGGHRISVVVEQYALSEEQLRWLPDALPDTAAGRYNYSRSALCTVP